MKYQEIEGDLISLAKEGKFEVIAHGCNCQCVQGAGIAKQMVETFYTNKFPMELLTVKEDIGEGDYADVPTNNKGDINKLGQIDFETKYLWFKHPMKKENESSVVMNHMTVGQPNVQKLTVVNAYTQYMYGTNHTDGVSKPLDYEALTLCLKKINHIFKGKHIGLPAIGTGLAGGVWDWTDTKTHMWSAIDLFKYQSGAKKDVKTIIKEELKDMNVTVVHYKPN